MTVRCMYGSIVQEEAEKRGSRKWCDENCQKTYDGHECFAHMMSLGVDPRQEMITKKQNDSAKPF